MSNPIAGEDFYSVGGTLGPEAPSYVTRQADRELMQALLAGQYCNVLMARQMGKSSLMVRAARDLRNKGIRTVVIDLTSIGTQVSADQWYLGVISRFRSQLRLAVDEASWWNVRGQLGPVQRFSDFLRSVVLDSVEGPIVVFVDEIDSTLSLPFTDDFFGAIRAAYNARASDPAYGRLTFVLLGVARPSDLIKDGNRTPYNIGQSIQMTDFVAAEAKVLLKGLAGTTAGNAAEILDRVLYWTDGHPYLTQKVCAEVVARGIQWTKVRVDELVRRLFLAEDSRRELNLQFIRDRILNSESRERADLLEIYCQIRVNKKRIMDDERSLAKSKLKLYGLLKQMPDGSLVVRNRIYAEVFDAQWLSTNMPERARPAKQGSRLSDRLRSLFGRS